MSTVEKTPEDGKVVPASLKGLGVFHALPYTLNGNRLYLAANNRSWGWMSGQNIYQVEAIRIISDKDGKPFVMGSLHIQEFPGCCGCLIVRDCNLVTSYLDKDTKREALNFPKEFFGEVVEIITRGFGYRCAVDCVPKTYPIAKAYEDAGFKTVSEFKNNRTGNRIRVYSKAFT